MAPEVVFTWSRRRKKSCSQVRGRAAFPKYHSRTQGLSMGNKALSQFEGNIKPALANQKAMIWFLRAVLCTKENITVKL